MKPNTLIKKIEHNAIDHQISGITVFSTAQIIEMPEVKKPRFTIADEANLSEFERARRTNKTWSMGQDWPVTKRMYKRRGAKERRLFKPKIANLRDKCSYIH